MSISLEIENMNAAIGATRQPSSTSSPATTAMTTTPCHPIVNLITKAIIQNFGSGSISPPTVQVHDLTVWHKNRSAIGPKRHAARLIKKQCHSTPSTGHVKYSCAIYDLDLKGKVVKRVLGTYSTYAKASKACERACTLRDNPSLGKQGFSNSTKRRQSNKHMFQRKVLSKHEHGDTAGQPTHLNVFVVSKKFCGMTHRDRVKFVYDTILPVFCTDCEHSECILFASSRLNKYGTVGEHVLSLRHFMHLRSSLCSHLLFDLRTPNQYGFLADDIVPVTDNQVGSLDQFIHQLIQPSILREIVSQPASTNASRRENDNPFGHFFHDMKKDAKNLVMSEYKTNLNMISGDKRVLEKNSYLRNVVRAGHVKVVANELLSMEKETIKSDVRNKSFIAQLGDKSIWQMPSAQNSNGDEIMMQYDLLMSRITHHVLRIQRLYRARYFHRTQREWYNQHRAALLLQCAWKGFCGRCDVQLLRGQLALAPGIIQKVWRGYRGRCKAKQLRAVLTGIALKMQPIIRGVIGRKYFSWLISNRDFATAIQRIARGFASRRKVDHLKFVKLAVLHKASAVRIQMCARMWMSKVVFDKRKWHVLVVIPSVLMIQSHWQKYIARIICTAKRRTRNAIVRIQAWIRGFISKRHNNFFVEKRHRRICAIKIQSHARRWIAKEIFRRAMARKYRKFVVIPSAVMIQARYRCYVHEHALLQRKLKWKSAILIQNAYRRLTQVRLLERLRHQEHCRLLNLFATKVQANYRGYRARYLFENMKTTEISRRVYACRVILRAWIRHKNISQSRALNNMWMLSRGKAALVSIAEEKEETIIDLQQVSYDIELRRKFIDDTGLKIKETKTFIEQACARKELVQLELSSLYKDAQSGDRSSLLEDEQFVLSNRISMARQHLQKSKIQLGRIKEELHALLLEQIDIQMGLDGICVLEIDEHEWIRRFEVQKAAKAKDEDKRRRIRHEINKWKAKYICRNGVYKECDAIANSKQSDLKERSLEQLSSVSFAKEQTLLNDEILAKRHLTEEGRHAAYKTLARQNFEENAIKRNTFDNITSATLVILKDRWKNDKC
uniref:Uncharacterized protein n=1 Tax=Leptocylindrus danicus TaxID=163516 RepID=A0A7S2KUG7_9STRA|mmetsp:Transcript_26113/g.38919  ORF Transcript_26113/g.38919 Transcript_26113/m.38919 type:complete len:1067 (+) Transcript_26113:198-3398(+)